MIGICFEKKKEKEKRDERNELACTTNPPHNGGVSRVSRYKSCERWMDGWMDDRRASAMTEIVDGGLLFALEGVGTKVGR